MGQNLFKEPVAADKATLREFDTAAIAGIVLKEHPLKADFETVGNDAASGVKDGDTIVLKTPLGFEHAALWFDGEGGTPRIGNIRRYIAAATITGLVDPSVWPAVDDYGQSVKITVIDGVEVGHYEHNGVSWVPTKINNSYTVGTAGGGGDVTTAQLNAVVNAQDTRDDAQDLVIAGNKAFADAQPAIDAAQDAEILANANEIALLKQFDALQTDASTKRIPLARPAPADTVVPQEVLDLTGKDAEVVDTALVLFTDYVASYTGGTGNWAQKDRTKITGAVRTITLPATAFSHPEFPFTQTDAEDQTTRVYTEAKIAADALSAKSNDIINYTTPQGGYLWKWRVDENGNLDVLQYPEIPVYSPTDLLTAQVKTGAIWEHISATSEYKYWICTAAGVVVKYKANTLPDLSDYVTKTELASNAGLITSNGGVF